MKTPLLNDVLHKKPIKPLYHYTGQTGFIGIISQSKIWATHTQYLNDRREYLHAIDLLRDRIKHHSTSASPEDKKFLSQMTEALAIANVEKVNVCICSFSEESDSLSQWRAYGSPTSGFAIGFTGDFLADVALKEEWYLAPCIYDSEIQLKIIDALVLEVLDEHREATKTPPTDDDMHILGGSLISYLHRYAPLLKDPSFSVEKEWRLISRPLSCRSEDFDFRVGNSMLTPYYKFPLLDTEGDLKLFEIVVGPTPHPEQAKLSAQSFLVRNAQSYDLVKSSKVPFRSW